jgi:hypothetical protein
VTARKGGERYERSVFLPDAHAPYHDEAAFDTALAFVRFYKPGVIFVMGDWVDAYQLSRFDKRPDRRLELQNDLDISAGLLKRLRKSAQAAIIFYLRGNHEHRLQRYLWSQAPELSGLRCLELPRLLALGEHDVRYVERGFTRYAGTLVKHGSIVSNKAGYTASRELDRCGMSGISAHTHRLAQVYRRTHAGYFTWAEAGCLCLLDPGSRMDGYGEDALFDWQTGLVAGNFERGGNRFECRTLPIVKNAITYDGKDIKP